MELANLFWLLLLAPVLIEAQKEAPEETRRKPMIKDQQGKVNRTAVGLLEDGRMLREGIHHEAETVQCTTFDLLTRTEGGFCLCLNKPSELCPYLKNMDKSALIPAISQMNCGRPILWNALNLVKQLSPPVHCLGDALCGHLNHGLDDSLLTEQQVKDSLRSLKPFQMLMPPPCLIRLINRFIGAAVSVDAVNAIGDLLSESGGELGEMILNKIRELNGGSLRPADLLTAPEESLTEMTPEELERDIGQADRTTREQITRRIFSGMTKEDSQSTRPEQSGTSKPDRLRVAALDQVRPLSAISVDSAKQMLQVPGLEFSTSLGEIEEMTPAQVCFSDPSSADNATADVYEHLSRRDRMTFAEKCGSTLGENLPASLKISKKPSDIQAELQQSDSATKISKAKAFSENIDKLTKAMKAVLRESLRGTVSADSLTDEAVTNAAVIVREMPVAEIISSLYTTTGKDHYCRTMADSFMDDIDRTQVKDILDFCKTAVSLCDLNNLLSELRTADVTDTSLLDDTTFMECKGALSRSRHPETLAAIKTRAETIGSLSSEDRVQLVRCFVFAGDIPLISAADLDAYCPVLADAFSEILWLKAECSASYCPSELMSRLNTAFMDIFSVCWNKFVVSLTSTAGSTRRKRAGETTCTAIQAAGDAPYVVTTFSESDIGVVECDAFNMTDGCLSHLAVDGLTEVQLMALATRSQACLGAADTWDTATQTALGTICLGLSQQAMAYIDLNQTATVDAIGQNVKSEVGSTKLAAAYGQFKSQTSKQEDTMTSSDLTSLGLLNCGMTPPNIGSVPQAAISTVAGLLGRLKCFDSIRCEAIVAKLLAAYQVTDVAQLTATQIADMGNLVVCLETSFIQALTADKMGYITTYAIANMSTANLQALTVEQIGFMSVEQANAITAVQLSNLTQAQQNAVTCVKNPSETICQSTETTTASSGSGSGGGNETATQEPSGEGEGGATQVPSGEGEGGATQEPSGEGEGGATQEPSGEGEGSVTQEPSGEGEGGVTQEPSGEGEGGGTATEEPGSGSNSTGGTNGDGDGDGDGNGDGTSSGGSGSSENVDYQEEASWSSSLTLSDLRQMIVGSIRPSELSNLSPAQLQEKDILREFLDEGTVGMLAKLGDVASSVITEKASGTNFDEGYLAIVADITSQAVVDGMSLAQLLAVTSDSNFRPDKIGRQVYAKAIAAQLAAATTATAAEEILRGARQIFRDVPFGVYINALDQVTLDKTLLDAIAGELTPTQARRTLKKYITDSQVDVSGMSPVDQQEWFYSLPSNLKPFVNVADFDSSVALDILDRMPSHMLDVEAGADYSRVAGAFQQASAIYSLLDKVRAAGLATLSGNALEDFMESEPTLADIKQLGVKACIKEHSRDVSAGSKKTYELCKSTYGTMTFANVLANYGGLQRSAPPADIIAQVNDMDTVGQFCRSTLLNLEMAKALGQAAEKVINLGNVTHFDEAECVLPFISLDKLKTVSAANKPKLCGHLACAGSYHLMALSEISPFLEFCIPALTCRHLTCAKDMDTPLPPLASAIKTSHFTTDLLTCAKIDGCEDRLAATVTNCDARARILECAKTNNKTVVDNLAELGGLCEQFLDSDWTSITQTVCDKKPWLLEDRKKLQLMSGLVDNFTPRGSQDCGPIPSKLDKCVQKLASYDCGASKRRRRATAALTCLELKKYGQTVHSAVSATQLAAMTTAEFDSCASFLGVVVGFTEAHFEALAAKAVEAWGSADTWTADEIARGAGIISGLSEADIEKLALGCLTDMDNVGTYGKWSGSKLASAFKKFKKDCLTDDLTKLKSYHMQSIGEIMCGATSEDIKNINSADYCIAAENIGSLMSCEATQMQQFMVHAKVCHGDDVTTWDLSAITDVGTMLGGLPQADIKLLSGDQLGSIEPWTIEQIPPNAMAGFTPGQLESFSANQASKITENQYLSMTDDQKGAVDKANAAVIADGASNTGSNGGDGTAAPDNGGELLEASLMLVFTGMLAALLRI